jgi:ComEC/Rec2-related protein
MGLPVSLSSSLFFPACLAAAGTLAAGCCMETTWACAGFVLYVFAWWAPRLRRWALFGVWFAFGAWWMARMEAHLQPGTGKAYRWECLVVAPPRPYGTQWDHGCVCRVRGTYGPTVPQRLRVAWAKAVPVGAQVEVVGRWEPWETRLGFDAVRAYRPAGWGARLTPLGKAPPTSQPVQRPWAYHLFRARCAIESFWSAHLSPRVAGLMQGLSTGSTAGIQEDVQAAFAETGLVHVLSVSGYHVGLLGFLPLLLLRSRHRALRKMGFVLLLPLWGYMGVCGWTVPAIRACTMSTWYALGQLFNRPVTAVQSWAVALMATVVWRPVACAQLGTQLSFLAVLGIVVAAAAVKHRGKGWRFVAVATAATGSTAPLTAPVFGLFPWAFLPVNALAGPWVSLLGGLALISTFVPASWGGLAAVDAVGAAFLDAVVYAAGRWQLAWPVGDLPEGFFWWGTATACVWMASQWMPPKLSGRLKWMLLALWPVTLVSENHAVPADWVLVRGGAPAVLFRVDRGTWCAVSAPSEVERAARAWKGLPADWRDARTPCTPCRFDEHGVHGVLTPVGGGGSAAGVPWSFSRRPHGTGVFRWGDVSVPWERWGDLQAGRGP